MAPPTVEILYFDGCPHTRGAIDPVCAVAAETTTAVDVREVRVVTYADAVRLRFLGSPSVRVDGRDVEPGAEDRGGYGLQCRLYVGGLPSATWIRDALRA
jgi:hypothetical protein